MSVKHVFPPEGMGDRPPMASQVLGIRLEPAYPAGMDVHSSRTRATAIEGLPQPLQAAVL